jgi:hypothetical protein
VRFLPHDDSLTFLAEFIETLHACTDLGNVAALTHLINAWKETAEIHSDPELLKAAKIPLDGSDYGEVPGGADQ